MDLNDPGQFDDEGGGAAVLDLDALTEPAVLDPLREEERLAALFDELARMTDPWKGYSTMELAMSAPALDSMRYVTMHAVSSAAQFAELASSGVLGSVTVAPVVTEMLESVVKPVTVDWSSLISSVEKYVAPDWASMVPSVSSLLREDVVSTIGGSFPKELGGTLLKELGGPFCPMDSALFGAGSAVTQSMLDAVRPAVSSQAFLEANGIDARSLGFDALRTGADALHLDGILTGALSFDPMADVMRDLDERAAEFDAMMRAPAPLESYAYVPASTVAPSIVERDVGVRERQPDVVLEPVVESDSGCACEPVVIVQDDVPGWVKVGVVFAGWDSVLNTVSHAIEWVDRLG